MIGMEVAGLAGTTTAQDMMTAIQVTVTGGETTEASIDETVGQGLHPQGEGRDPGIGITGDTLGKERGTMATLTSDDGRITERGI